MRKYLIILAIFKILYTVRYHFCYRWLSFPGWFFQADCRFLVDLLHSKFSVPERCILEILCLICLKTFVPKILMHKNFYMGRHCILIPFALTQQINLRKDNSYFSSNIMNEWAELFMVIPPLETKWILGRRNCSQEGNQ